jgi:hypothetical protein
VEPVNDMDRIFRQLESIQVQLREMTASISANLSEHGNAITGLQRDNAARTREDELLHNAITLRFEKDEVDINRAFSRIKAMSDAVDARFKSFEDAQQQIEGARKVWVVGISCITALGAILGLIHFFSK